MNRLSPLLSPSRLSGVFIIQGVGFLVLNEPVSVLLTPEFTSWKLLTFGRLMENYLKAQFLFNKGLEYVIIALHNNGSFGMIQTD